MKTKICTKCGKEKPIKYFYKDIQKENKLTSSCKTCHGKYYQKNIKTIRKTQQQYFTEHRERNIYNNIMKRCNNPENNRYRWYGGKGIKCLITPEEIKQLWFRDKAYNMKKPSIDREDSNGDYIYGNCRFIEMPENTARATKKCILQYTSDYIFIKEWKSLTSASMALNIPISSISACLSKRRKRGGGYDWKYKEEK